MTRLAIKAAFTPNPMIQPLLDGTVVPTGIDWNCMAIEPSELYWRQLRFAEFDVSEMSMSSFIIDYARGSREWTPIPVFTRRRFFHTGIIVRSDAGVVTPSDLAGRRVGVAEYQQTAAVWSRGVLRDEFGVFPEDIHWFMERSTMLSHAGAVETRLPDSITLQHVEAESSLATMLQQGEIDAILSQGSGNNLIDRSTIRAGAIAGTKTLFPDPIAEGLRYRSKTGLFPFNHVVVVRSTLLDREPWIALNLYWALVKAKEITRQSIVRALRPWLEAGTLPAPTAASMRDIDPVPYGLSHAARELDVLSRYLEADQLIDERVAVPDCFASSTADL